MLECFFLVYRMLGNWTEDILVSDVQDVQTWRWNIFFLYRVFRNQSSIMFVFDLRMFGLDGWIFLILVYLYRVLGRWIENILVYVIQGVRTWCSNIFVFCVQGVQKLMLEILCSWCIGCSVTLEYFCPLLTGCSETDGSLFFRFKQLGNSETNTRRFLVLIIQGVEKLILEYFALTWILECWALVCCETVGSVNWITFFWNQMCPIQTWFWENLEKLSQMSLCNQFFPKFDLW